MKVKIRDFECDPVYLCKIDQPFEANLEDVIKFIKHSGGAHVEGEVLPFHSYQIVLDEGEIYVEIIVGEEE